MGGYRRTYGDERGELLTSGSGGTSQHIKPTFSKLYDRETLLQIEREKEEPSGRRVRLRPDKLPHVGDKALGKVDLPQSVCANCGTGIERYICPVCGGQTRAPSEQEIQEACRQARAG